MAGEAGWGWGVSTLM